MMLYFFAHFLKNISFAFYTRGALSLVYGSQFIFLTRPKQKHWNFFFRRIEFFVSNAKINLVASRSTGKFCVNILCNTDLRGKI